MCVVTQKKVPVRVNEGEVAIDRFADRFVNRRTNKRARVGKDGGVVWGID